MEWKWVAWWMPMIVIAVANGTLRQAVLLKPLGELRAHQASTVTAIVFFGVYIAWLMRRWAPLTRTETLEIGALWLVLTVAFEFGMGRLLLRREWSTLLHDYNVFAGRVWLFLLLWLLVAPTILAPRALSDGPR